MLFKTSGVCRLCLQNSAGSLISKVSLALGGFSCYPDCSEGDESIPSYHAYNHHYFSWLQGADSVMEDSDTPTFLPNPTTTKFTTAPGVEHGFPTNIVFKASSLEILTINDNMNGNLIMFD